MSTSEYYDLFLTSQQNGKYHIFVFDIKNSKKMNKESKQIAAIKTEKLMLKYIILSKK